MSEDHPLAKLLARAAGGDRASFRALYDATSAKLLGTILRICKDRDLARDLLQEVYVKIWQNARSFDATQSSPVTWMVAIARYRAIDEMRRRKPETSGSEQELDDAAAEFVDPLASRDRREEAARLSQCLDGLEAERRQAILLAYCYGASRESLAERFARPVATIKTWLRRSLTQLRGCLEG
ncbi:MAG: sigma-70 family RNA polymerase sigma factor [Ancalomicrobiaceae bacterium]|nr:sigma-70 family RNA polymerase sigma factor [Ancalomicrobiaceae bacterium]